MKRIRINVRLRLSDLLSSTTSDIGHSSLHRTTVTLVSPSQVPLFCYFLCILLLLFATFLPPFQLSNNRCKLRLRISTVHISYIFDLIAQQLLYKDQHFPATFFCYILLTFLFNFSSQTIDWVLYSLHQTSQPCSHRATSQSMTERCKAADVRTNIGAIIIVLASW